MTFPLHEGTQGQWSRLAVFLFALLVFWSLTSNAAAVADYLNDAKAYLEKGESSAAVIQLKNALLLEPDNAEARLLLGRTYLEFGDGASAEKEIFRARKLGLEPAQWLVPLGRAYLLLGRYDDLLSEITIEEAYPPDFGQTSPNCRDRPVSGNGNSRLLTKNSLPHSS